MHHSNLERWLLQAHPTLRIRLRWVYDPVPGAKFLTIGFEQDPARVAGSRRIVAHYRIARLLRNGGEAHILGLPCMFKFS